MSTSTLALITVPFVTGAIGYRTNWTGVLMLFYPVHFRGVRAEWLQSLARLLPYKLRQMGGRVAAAPARRGARLRRRPRPPGAVRMTEPEDPLVEEAARIREPADALAEPDILAELLPAIARLGVRAWLHGAAWGIDTSMRTGRRLARAAVDPDAAADLVIDVRQELRGYAREFLGVNEIDEQVQLPTGPGGASTLSRRGRRNGRVTDSQALRQLGAALLKQAADVYDDDTAHPAYARILTELAPDEARILRVLASDGPQPIVDVQATNLIGVGSQLVAQSLNMMGAQAGLRYRYRVPAYLNNLHRLGLIWLSDEPLPDPISYQVLEAQPDVLRAIKDTTRAKTMHRSLRLSPFGQDFCDVCLPLDITEIEELTAGD